MPRALLVIDVQNEYFTGKLPVTYPANSLKNILRAMDAAQEKHVPVVVIQHTAPQRDSTTFRRGSREWELLPEVADREHDVLIHKSLPGSFTNTELEPWLRQHGIETVVIAGYMTQMCCDTTSRQAVHLEFKVEFLSMRPARSISAMKPAPSPPKSCTAPSWSHSKCASAKC